jgi:tetratricopeptide (TPR) repeat protein
MKHDRRNACRQELMKAWTESDNDEQRIPVLKRIIKKYPKHMAPLSEMASAYLNINDIENALKIYAKIIENPSVFEDICLFTLGKSYLILNQTEKAIECFLSKDCCDEDQGLFLSFAYLKSGDSEKAKKLFDCWITEFAERAFKKYVYRKYFKPIFGESPNNMIIETWANYHKTYSEMASYDLYCLIYDQTDNKRRGAKPSDDDYFDNSRTELPPKLTKSEFIRCSLEYLDIDRKFIHKNPLDKEAYERMDELRELIFADIIF